jgi:hypothetical protein
LGTQISRERKSSSDASSDASSGMSSDMSSCLLSSMLGDSWSRTLEPIPGLGEKVNWAVDVVNVNVDGQECRLIFGLKFKTSLDFRSCNGSRDILSNSVCTSYVR